MNVSAKPIRVFRTLLKIVAVLLILGIVTRLLFHYFKSPASAAFSFLFNLDEEHNIPALYSFFQLLAASFLLALIARDASQAKKKLRLYWWLMAGLFFYMAFDELESFHERGSLWIHQHLQTTGFFYFAWVMPAVVVLLVLAIILFRFLRDLPKDVRRRFVLSGTVYVAGAVGGDAVAGKYISIHGSGLGWPYVLEYHIEETMELLAIAYFIYALLLYIQDYIREPVIFRITSD